MSPLAPTSEQLAWQQSAFGIFFHFGMNTFHGKEWSDGTLPASSFDPIDFDAHQWAEVAAASGASYVILTAKHHDGFCLWPTSTTDYSVASSPWRDGQGDVVAEVVRACRAKGLTVGLYLSPWDRNSPVYADPAAYDDLYDTQLTELCSNYGELTELWFDGAGSEGRAYDWPRIMGTAGRLQPQAMIFNMGAPTIRWVGNEDGLADDPVEYVAIRTPLSNYVEGAAELSEPAYLPPECDVSIRPGWFWHPSEQPKSVEHLMAIWYRSVGLGANLLLNVPPTSRGLVDEVDVVRIAEFRAALDARFADPVVVPLERAGGQWTAVLDPTVVFDHLELVEDVSAGQRVFDHEVVAITDAGEQRLAAGHTIGVRRLHLVGEHTASELLVRVDDPAAVLTEVRLHRTGVTELPVLPDDYLAPTTAPID